MKKKILFTLLTVCLIFGVMVLSVAAANQPLLCDEADLLSDYEENMLLEKLRNVKQTCAMDVVVVTVESIGFYTPQEYADNFYDKNGYAEDGLLLLVSMEESDWYISTCGYAITAFTDAGIQYIGDQITPYLSDEEYADAFSEFVKQCEAFVAQARTGDPYDIHNLPKEPFNVLIAAGIALIIGFLVAIIYTSGLKNQLKTVRKQTAAFSYVRDGSVSINKSRDLFMYRNISRTPRQTSKSGSGTHRSSSGIRHGGGGGKF